VSPSVYPLLFIAGFFAAVFTVSRVLHWTVLIRTCFGKLGGDFLGAPKRRLIWATPFVFLFHSAIYLILGVLAASVLAIAGRLPAGWCWFMTGFYAYALICGLLVLNVMRKHRSRPNQQPKANKLKFDTEIELKGGRTTDGVVRIGDTVHRPISARSGFVHSILRHLEAKGFHGAPRFLGLDDKGREVLTFLPGEVPNDLGSFTDDQIAAAANLLRSLHDATTDCELRAGNEIICHGDPSPCNCVFVDGVPSGFIDFDAAHPGARDDDVGYAAWLWLDIGNNNLAPETQGRRLITFLTAYDFLIERNPLELVLAAQRDFTRRLLAPTGAAEWARACLDWTERHRERIEAGVALARPRAR
jgi:hypothetical protein